MATVREDLWNNQNTKDKNGIKDEYYTQGEAQMGQVSDTAISGFDNLIGKTDELYNQNKINSNKNFQNALDSNRDYNNNMKSNFRNYADMRGLGSTTGDILADIDTRHNGIYNKTAKENNEYEDELSRVQGLTKSGFEADKSTAEHNRMNLILDMARQIQEAQEEFNRNEEWNQKEYDLDVLLSKKGSSGGGGGYRRSYRGGGYYSNNQGSPDPQREATINKFNDISTGGSKYQNTTPNKTPGFWDNLKGWVSGLFGKK